jgi:diguanylate cyclase (GGDEF)-like protein
MSYPNTPDTCVKDRRSSKGLAYLVVTLPLIAALWAGSQHIYALYAETPGYLYAVNTVVPLSGIALGLLLLLAGLLSYSRIHSVRVYLFGVVGGSGIALFCLLYWLKLRADTPGYLDLFAPVWYVLSFVNASVLCVVPARRPYKTTQWFAVAALALNAALVVTLMWATPVAELLSRKLFYDAIGDTAFWLGSVWVLLQTVLVFRLIRAEFGFGGLLLCFSLCLGAAWSCGLCGGAAVVLEPLLLCGAAVLGIGGMVVHTLVCMEQRIAYDPLLRIYNREYCSRIIDGQSRLDLSPPLCIAMIDIDHFKSVNDTYGHQAGDQALWRVAQTVKQCVVPDATLCRYGGEEMIVFFPKQALRLVAVLLEKTRKTVGEQKNIYGGKEFAVTVSIGLSCRTSREQSIGSVIAAADRALYRAKQNGRNQVRSAKVTA